MTDFQCFSIKFPTRTTNALFRFFVYLSKLSLHCLIGRSKLKNQSNSHSILNRISLLIDSPLELEASHRKIPSFDFWTMSISSWELWLDRRIKLDSSRSLKASPVGWNSIWLDWKLWFIVKMVCLPDWANFHVIRGRGCPLASQRKVAFCPAATTASEETKVHVGGAMHTEHKRTKTIKPKSIESFSSSSTYQSLAMAPCD